MIHVNEIREKWERNSACLTKRGDMVNIHAKAMLTLRQLRYLDALARHGHFGRAAEECSVSQPALSMQISELEKELGTKLVEHRQGQLP